MNENLPETGQRVFDPDTFEILQEALGTGELTLERNDTYQDQPAKEGYVFYHMIYITKQDQVPYAGAYEISLDAEEKLKQQGKLERFLLYQLAHEL